MSGFVHHPPGGARLLAENETGFRLWAPGCDAVFLEIEGQPPLAMARTRDGWFETVAYCGAGARYRYRVAPELAVPDPCSRFQPEDVHGPSEVIDPEAYRWQNAHWMGRPWHETVICELHAGLCDGFEGVKALLPSLAEAGYTAIELMPVADFAGTRNWGYDGVLPYAPDSAYGRPEQLKALIDAAHGLGLMVFLDVVYNHFGPEGNYLNAYAPPFFREDLHTPWGAAIDFRQRAVRDYFIGNALYWLQEYRFDGLRLDAVHAISDPDFLDELAATVRRHVEPGRQVHLMLENEHNVARHLEPGGGYDAQWNDDGHNALHVLLTGETEGYYGNYAEKPVLHLARVLAEGFAYQGEPSPSHDGQTRGTRSAHLPPTAFILFLQNHDQVGNRAFGERLSTLADPAALRAATVLQLLSPQIPLCFRGEERGSRTPFLFFTDFHGGLADAVREGRRREFAKFPVFADEQARARIPDPNDAATFERCRLEADEALLPAQREQAALFRQLLRLRRERLVSRLPGCTSLGAAALGSHAVSARWQLGDGARLFIAANLGAEAVELRPWPQAEQLPPLFETAPGVAAEVAHGRLPPQSACVLIEEPA